MDGPTANRWAGKPAEEVLGEAVHQLRAPIHAAVGSLSMLKLLDQLSAKQTQEMIQLALDSALRAKEVIDAISLYTTERQDNP
jgi:hypothetical protein